MNQRTRLLFVMPFSVVPRYSGGSHRGYHVLRELVRHFDVTCVYFGQSDQLLDAIRQDLGESATLRVVSPDHANVGSRIANRVRFALSSRTLRYPTNSVFLACLSEFEAIVRSFKPHIVYLTELTTVMLGRVARRIDSSITTIVDMYNVNGELLRQEVAQNPTPALQRQLASTRSLERSLFKFVNKAVVCSDDDRTQFAKLTGRGSDIFVVPNGVDTTKMSFDNTLSAERQRSMLFVGNFAYHPNVDAIDWFLEHAWKQVAQRDSSLTLTVVGRGCPDELSTRIAACRNVEFIGEVPDIVPYYRRCGAVIVPLRLGSGTRLKILEAMSLGNPVISTSLGCQGIHDKGGAAVAIADSPEDFADRIQQLATDSEQYLAYSQAGIELTRRKFDWTAIGRALTERISSWRLSEVGA